MVKMFVMNCEQICDTVFCDRNWLMPIHYPLVSDRYRNRITVPCKWCWIFTLVNGCRKRMILNTMIARLQYGYRSKSNNMGIYGIYDDAYICATYCPLGDVKTDDIFGYPTFKRYAVTLLIYPGESKEKSRYSIFGLNRKTDTDDTGVESRPHIMLNLFSMNQGPKLFSTPVFDSDKPIWRLYNISSDAHIRLELQYYIRTTIHCGAYMRQKSNPRKAINTGIMLIGPYGIKSVEFNRNSFIFIQVNAFENTAYKIATIFSRGETS